MTKIQKYQAEGSGWANDSVTEQSINVSEQNFVAGSCNIKLPKELNHSSKGLIIIQNTDSNKFLKWF